MKRPVPPPADLRAARLRGEGLDLVVMSWPAGAPDPMSLLTPAEQEVAGLLLAGHARLTIARLRGTAPRTVDKQIERLYARLGVSSRTELANVLSILSVPA